MKGLLCLLLFSNLYTHVYAAESTDRYYDKQALFVLQPCIIDNKQINVAVLAESSLPSFDLPLLQGTFTVRKINGFDAYDLRPLIGFIHRHTAAAYQSTINRTMIISFVAGVGATCLAALVALLTDNYLFNN